MCAAGDTFVRHGRQGRSHGGPGLQKEAGADARPNNVKRSDKSTAPAEDSDVGIGADGTALAGASTRNRMPAPSNESGRADPTDPGSEQRLLGSGADRIVGAIRPGVRPGDADYAAMT